MRLGWIKRLFKKDSDSEGMFARQAQLALDAQQPAGIGTGSRGSMYRAGVSLADLRPGECGTVRRLIAPQQTRLRLLEMGLTPGTHIRLLRAAAFGGPVDILIRNYHLSLRRDEAEGVWLDDTEEAKAAALALSHLKLSTPGPDQ